MSTRIEDLPGSIPEDVMGDIQDIQQNIRQQQLDDEIVRQNTLTNRQPSIDPELYRAHPSDSNVTMNIKKRVKFRDQANETDDELESKNTDVLTTIKEEINEENLLLLVVMILASRNDFDQYIKNIPVLTPYISDSLILITITKCMLLLVLFISFKHFVLPKIKI
jgi:hypothetical protein